jgi:hypothetical protein
VPGAASSTCCGRQDRSIRAKKSFDTAVALGKLSQITGVSTENSPVYYKAATDVGVAHEAVDKGLAKLARSFVTLQAGNGAERPQDSDCSI